MKFFRLFFSCLCLCALPSFLKGESLQDASILPVFKLRHSGRSYESSRPVSKEQMHLLAEAAKMAPSSYNDQPWGFIFCDRTTSEGAFAKVMKGLVEFNQGWAKNAPLLIVIAANTQSRQTKKDNPWGIYDTGAAATCMALQAAYMGLMAHQMGGFDPEIIRKEFSIPSHYVPVAIMAVGYETLDEAAKSPSKERLPLSENFFLSAWGKGLFETKEIK